MKKHQLLYLSITFLSCIFLSAAVTPSCNCVYFRLDDVQDQWGTGAQKAVIDVFRSNNYPMSIGIIANQFGTGSNPSFVNYIKTGIQTSGWDFDITCHGYNHEDFTVNLTLEQQRVLINNATQRILTSLDNLIPYVRAFIPPYNSVNANLMTALIANGYTHISSEVDQDPGPYPWNTTGLYHWPIQSQTSNQPETEGITAEATWAQIQRQLNTYGFAGVMMHPPEFSQMNAQGEVLDAVNQTQVNELVKLVQMVLNAGLKLVTISSVEKNVIRPTTGVLTTAPLTTAPLTTGPLTTAPLTTAPLTTAPMTTGELTTAPMTTGELTTAPMTTGEITTAPMTTGEITTGEDIPSTTGSDGRIIEDPSSATKVWSTLSAFVSIIVSLVI